MKFQPNWYIVAAIIVIGALVAFANLQPSELTDTNASPTDQSTAYEVVEVASGLSVPWDIAFTSSTRILVTERAGRIRVIENGKLATKPLHTFTDVVSASEAGLMGMTVDPNYANNKFIYVVYAYRAGNDIRDKVVRFTDAGNALTDPKTIIDRIPAASNHAGSRLGFGPDGKLYITTGDATERSIAQDLKSLGGKILRVNADGTIPSDNPFKNSPIWSYGHRNPQGIDWHPQTKELYESEHGPSGFDGPGGGDEINRIQKGANYGWPLVSHDETKSGTIAPLAVYTPAVAPAGVLVYSGKALPQFKNNLFAGALRGTGLLRLTLENGKVTARDQVPEVDFGRIRAVVEGPDGFIYFSTSNRDGRGNPASSDDRIFVIRPK